MPDRRPIALVAILAVGMIAAGLVAAPARAAHGPPHPKRWDPRILPLVRFVERARGLKFRHPVFVEYLDDADFRREVVDDPATVSDRERRDQRVDEVAVRALGLPDGKGGLAEEGDVLTREATLAWYDDGTERVEVRGTDMTTGRRATLVHELTHALQDQHFDISREGSYASDDRNAAFEAVIEGDAVRIEDAYVDSLPRAEQDAYGKEQAAGDADYAARIADVPDWLSATGDAPYTLGEEFTAALAGARGRRAVDRALRNPPRSQADTMNAARYLRGDRLRKIRPPAVPAGDRVAKRNDFGALRWLLLLAERIPAADAVRAVDGWGGDAYLAYEHQGRMCVKVDFMGVRPAATDEMARALSRWAAAMPPAGGAGVSRRKGVVELASCDPGPAAVPGPSVAGSHVAEAMKLLTDRAVAFADAVG